MTFKFGITDFSGEVVERMTGSVIKHPTSESLSVSESSKGGFFVTGGIFQTSLVVTDAEAGTVDVWKVENFFTPISDSQCTAVAKCDKTGKDDLTFLFDYKIRKEGKWFTYADLNFVKVLD